MKLVSRKQLAEKLGIPPKKLTELIYKKKITPPPVVHRDRCLLYYSQDAVEAFIKTKPMENMPTKSAEPPREKLDNALATAFIRLKQIGDDKPLTMSDIASKHIKKPRPKTIVVHLKERNDFVPPHSQLTPQYCSFDGIYSTPFGAILS